MLVNYFFISEIYLKNEKKYLIDSHCNTFMSEYQNFLILSHLSESFDVWRFTFPASCLMTLMEFFVTTVKPSRLSKLQYFTGQGPVHCTGGVQVPLYSSTHSTKKYNHWYNSLLQYKPWKEINGKWDKKICIHESWREDISWKCWHNRT